MHLTFLRLTLVLMLVSVCSCAFADDGTFQVTLRDRAITDEGKLGVRHRAEKWDAEKTAVIVCDMWDAHHCLNAVRRVRQMAPRMNEFLTQARNEGATIIHAPSSCMSFYEDHPARKHMDSVPKSADPPTDIQSWCHWKDTVEEETGYPIDHSDGGEDDDLEEHARWHEQLAAWGRNPQSPWIRQIELLEIRDEDFITDDGLENWSILEHRGIDNVMLVGVHTNMCVLGRPFGLRQLAKNGKNVVLVRDLTDTMYNPAMHPRVSHFSGTDLVVEHIEQYVCPTISSEQVLGGSAFRFRHDHRPHVVLLIGEQEYETARTLPRFARKHLYRDFKVSYVVADPEDLHHFPGIEVVQDADLLVVSVRRRTPPAAQLRLVRNHVAAGKPVVGIRTASHAFSLRGKAQPPAGHAAWPEFDAEVFGGNYRGHHGNKQDGEEGTLVWAEAGAAEQGTWQGLSREQRPTTSWLYKTSPLGPGTRILMMGRVGDRQPHEPVTWMNVHVGGGRAFYTSLGHPDDFQDDAFQRLLRSGIYWSLFLSHVPGGEPLDRRSVGLHGEVFFQTRRHVGHMTGPIKDADAFLSSRQLALKDAQRLLVALTD